MRHRVPRIAVATLIVAVLSAPAAVLSASCCMPPADAAVAALSCCGCDGSFTRPALADRAAIQSRPVPLAAAVADRPSNVDVLALTSGPPSAAPVPLRIARSSPFPRRL